MAEETKNEPQTQERGPLKEAALMITQSSIPIRLEGLQLLSEFLQQEEIARGPIRRTINILLSTASIYSNRTSILALCGAVSVFASADATVGAVPDLIAAIRRTSLRLSRATRLIHLNLLRISAAILQATDTSSSIPEWLPELAETQFALLEALETSEKSAFKRSGIAATLAMLRSSPTPVVDAYVAALLASTSPKLGATAVCLRFLLSSGGGAGGGAALAARGLRGPFVDSLVSLALSSRTPSAAAVAAFAPLLAVLSHEELAGTVMPALSRSLKRGRANAMPLAIAVASAVSVDLSAYAVEVFLGPALEECKQVAPERQARGVQLLTLTAAACSDSGVLATILTRIAAAMRGLPQWTQRQAMVRCIRAVAGCTKGISAAACAPLAEQAITMLAAAAAKEKHAPTRALALSSLAHWATAAASSLQQLPPSLPPQLPLRLSLRSCCTRTRCTHSTPCSSARAA